MDANSSSGSHRRNPSNGSGTELGTFRQRSFTGSNQGNRTFATGLMTKRKKSFRVRIVPDAVKSEKAVTELHQVKRARVIGQKWNPSTIFTCMWGLYIFGLCVYLLFNDTYICREWILFFFLRFVLLIPTTTLAVLWRRGWWPSWAPDPDWVGVFFAIYISVIVTLKFCTESNVNCGGEFESGVQLPYAFRIKLTDVSNEYNISMLMKDSECKIQLPDQSFDSTLCSIAQFEDVRSEFEINIYAWTGQLILYLFAFTSLFKPAFAATVVYNLLMVMVAAFGCALQGSSFWSDTERVDGSDVEQAVFVFLCAVVVNLYSAIVLHKMERDLVQANWELSASMAKRQKPPTGSRVVYLETDLQSSTKLWDQYTDTMHKAIKLHHNLMRELALEYFGWEIATEGDAFLLAFHDVFDAVSMALTFQAEMMHQDWPIELLMDEDAEQVDMPFTEVFGAGGVPSTLKRNNSFNQKKRNSSFTHKRNSSFGSAGSQGSFTRPASKSSPAKPMVNSAQARKRAGSLFKSKGGVGSPDGLLVFRGPRVRMAVHLGEGDFGTKGTTARFVHNMTDLSQGGMILLSRPVAEELLGVLDQLKHSSQDATQPRLVSMGAHTFDDCSDPMELYHIFSEPLMGRHITWGDDRLKLRNSQQHTLGFYDAPVHRPGVPEAATVLFGDIAHAESLRRHDLDAYNEGLAVVSAVMNPLLTEFNGYNVPQREGHYMMVFREPIDAARFHACLQNELMNADWPDELLELPDHLRPDYSVVTRTSFTNRPSGVGMGPPPGNFLSDLPDFYCGMCLSFGMAVGFVNKQLEAGRANYLGPTCNRAARISGLARRGQLLMAQSEYQDNRANLYSYPAAQGKDAYPITGHDLYQNVALKGISGSVNIVWLDTCPLAKSREMKSSNTPIGTAL